MFRFEAKETEHKPSTDPPRDSGAPGPSAADSGQIPPAADGGGGRGDAAVDASRRDDSTWNGGRDAGRPPSKNDPPSEPPDETHPSTPPKVDAGGQMDAGREAPDAGSDAGEAELLMCASALESLRTGTDTCHMCACDWCATQVLDCVSRGREIERQLCSDVLRCSLQYHCQDYTCYCRTPGCNLPEPVGNGPCANVVNRAAGGTRTRVDALRNASPLDPNEPLIRAGQAIACIYGVHNSSPGPAVPGNCNSTCE